MSNKYRQKYQGHNYKNIDKSTFNIDTGTHL